MKTTLTNIQVTANGNSQCIKTNVSLSESIGTTVVIDCFKNNQLFIPEVAEFSFATKELKITPKIGQLVGSEEFLVVLSKLE